MKCSLVNGAQWLLSYKQRGFISARHIVAIQLIGWKTLFPVGENSKVVCLCIITVLWEGPFLKAPCPSCSLTSLSIDAFYFRFVVGTSNWSSPFFNLFTAGSQTIAIIEITWRAYITSTARPHSLNFCCSRSGIGLRLCISNKSSEYADAPGPGLTCWKLLLWNKI